MYVIVYIITICHWISWTYVQHLIIIFMSLLNPNSTVIIVFSFTISKEHTRQCPTMKATFHMWKCYWNTWMTSGQKWRRIMYDRSRWHKHKGPVQYVMQTIALLKVKKHTLYFTPLFLLFLPPSSSASFPPYFHPFFLISLPCHYFYHALFQGAPGGRCLNFSIVHPCVLHQCSAWVWNCVKSATPDLP